MARTIRADERVEITLTVNGAIHRVSISPLQTLANVLRDHLGLTGAKVACGMANCGACTVLREGVPIYSCITLALDCDGHAITTIEGLSHDGELNAVQRAFIEKDALQCGFCTSGQILALSAYLHNFPEPSADDIRDALVGNLCRCGAYVKMIQAGLRAAEILKEDAGKPVLAPHLIQPRHLRAHEELDE